MYAQTSLVTSVRGAVFLPHTAASASLSFLGAKMPSPFFFIAKAFFFDAALMLILLVHIHLDTHTPIHMASCAQFNRNMTPRAFNLARN